MCGIFGVFANSSSPLSSRSVKATFDRLLVLSESRGKEAAGVALVNGQTVQVYKQAVSPKVMLKSRTYRRLLDAALREQDGEARRPCAIIGHSRLVTNGAQNDRANNQPVITAKMAGIHNGIIVNTRSLLDAYPALRPASAVDTEVLFLLIDHLVNESGSLAAGIRQAYAQIYGVANIAVFLKDYRQALLATNNGSLYLCRNEPGSVVIFASERYILAELLAAGDLKDTIGKTVITHLPPGRALLVDLDTAALDYFWLQPDAPGPVPEKGAGAPYAIEEIVGDDVPADEVSSLAPPGRRAPDSWVLEEYRRNVAGIARLRRCKKCVLPETVPHINLDDEGVCTDCRRHSSSEGRVCHGPEALAALVDRYRRPDGRPDCLIPISGGRDSCYTLHYFKKVLKMNPIAYTYDWGMVTDLARRNVSRLCSRLGVEHILVSADIIKKRKYIRMNVEAWLNKPDLGIIPLFMAGDKHYYYYAHQLRKHNDIQLIVYGMNALENTDFKSGFCGVTRNSVQGRQGGADTPGTMGSFRMLAYYLKAFLTNPGYLNSSLLDTFAAYLIYYLLPIHKDYIMFDDYIRWNEETIIGTLLREYDWETSPDTPSTWRIGDGTVPFYNYIYHTVAGFTENDTFRSNQIRAGMITREEALRLLEVENYPRFESIFWYCDTIGVDPDRAFRVINAIPKLYRV